MLGRFKATLADTQLFDVLVGYFRSSGFYQLYDSIELIEKTRILVGLGIDEKSYRTINQYHPQTVIDFESHSNAMVFEFYFPEELKTAGKEILKHMGELKPITNDMAEEEKLSIIQSEFDRLYDPNHPVRNNLETLDSVEEVRIIKEAV